MCPCDHAVRRDGVVAYYSTITAVFCDGRSLMLRCMLTCFRLQRLWTRLMHLLHALLVSTQVVDASHAF